MRSIIHMCIVISACGRLGDDAQLSFKCMNKGEHCHVPRQEGRTGERGRDGDPGRQGIPGTDGAQGEPGVGGAIGHTGAQGGAGPQGPQGNPGSNGLPGMDGQDGSDGADGQDGYSIVTQTAAIAVNDVVCPGGGTRLYLAQDTDRNGSWSPTDGNQQMMSICNGVNAPPTPYTPVGFVDPCGDAPGVWDEVFMRLQNGMLLASFSDNFHGDNTRLSILSPGTYQTTDGDNCVFTVSPTYTIINENHHW